MDREDGLLRWTDATADLQQLVAEGSFGPNLRLRQIGGVWQLIEVLPEVLQAGRPQLSGTSLTIPPVYFEDQAATINGIPSDNDPPPIITLTSSQVIGPTTVFVTASRPAVDEEWVLPAVVSVADGLLTAGGVTEYVFPVALIVAGQVIAGVPSA